MIMVANIVDGEYSTVDLLFLSTFVAACAIIEASEIPQEFHHRYCKFP